MLRKSSANTELLNIMKEQAYIKVILNTDDSKTAPKKTAPDFLPGT